MHPPGKTRREEEIEVWSPLVKTVLRKYAEVLVLQARERETLKEEDRLKVNFLSEEENRVFNPTSYYNWGKGIAVGLATFAVFSGGLIWSKQKAAVTTLPSRRAVQAAEAMLRSEPKRVTEKVQAPKKSDSSDYFSDVRFLMAGAFSTCVGYLAAGFTRDRILFFQHLSELPLKPGKSLLCYKVCPEILKEAPVANRLWKDPETEELEAVVRLVQNCQQRVDFERRLRKDQGLPASEQVEVPEPGVGLSYKY